MEWRQDLRGERDRERERGSMTGHNHPSNAERQLHKIGQAAGSPSQAKGLRMRQVKEKEEEYGERGAECNARHMQRDRQRQGHAARRSTMDYAASVELGEGRQGEKEREVEGGHCLFTRVILLALTAFVVLLFFMSVKNWQAASKTGHAR